VITRDTMIEPILRVSPRFEPTWREFLAEWKADADELPLYLLLSDLARHIAQLLEENADSELHAIFEVVENWHLQGDAYVKEAATIGLLEDLQNTNLVGKAAPSRLTKYLGPESKRWWTKVEEFWSKGQLIRDD
jgi:hypothetical protein